MKISQYIKFGHKTLIQSETKPGLNQKTFFIEDIMSYFLMKNILFKVMTRQSWCKKKVNWSQPKPFDPRKPQT